MVRGKKGFIGDAAFVIAVLFVLGLVAVVGFQFFGEFNDQFQASDEFDNNSKGLIQSNYDRYAGVWDGVIALGFGLLAVALVISTASLGTRPEFFFITVIVGFMMVGAVAILSNVWDLATGTGSTLSAAATDFTFSNIIFSNYPMIALVLVVLLLFGLFAKARGVF